MIEEIDQLQRKIERTIPELPNIINSAVRENIGEVIRMNVGQHLKGTDATGKKLGNYAESTKKTRRRKGLQVSFIDLEDTKSYHSNFALSFLKDRIEVASPETPYSIFLSNRWNELFGLTKENTEKLAKLIEPYCTNRLKQLLS